MTTPAAKSHKVLIIGGGFAGLTCARELADDHRFSVTLIDRNNHHLFQPLLYQVATASLAAPDIARSIRQIVSGAENITVLMDEITTIDTIGKTATGASGMMFSYDTLVVAAGTRTSFFGNNQWAANTLHLKTLADAQTLRRTVLANLEAAEMTNDEGRRTRLMTIAIVGGGPTGVELAGAFADLAHRSLRADFRRMDTRKLRIILIEASERVLEVFDEDQSAYCRKQLERDGVEIWTGKRVDDVAAGKLHFTDGTVLESEAIIWAAGVEAQPITAQLGAPLADRAGRIAPEPDLSLPGQPHVFIAGDITRMTDADGKPVPGLAPAATQMGKHIAGILKAEADGKEDARKPFRYFDKGFMAVIGKHKAVVKSGSFKMKGIFAWFAWLLIHILFLIGFRNRISVLLGWAYAYLFDNPQARVIVNTPRASPPLAD
ncbi:MAG: NAD(P)/FAD-dependent oxidoreductase [Verrucomicrobiota bacterium]